MAVARQKRLADRQNRRIRRADDFAVKRWLQLGAASAGMGAALLGFSLMGPQVGVAAADDTTGSSVSSTSSGTDAKDAAGSMRDSEADTDADTAADAESDPDADAETESEADTDAGETDDAPADNDVTDGHPDDDADQPNVAAKSNAVAAERHSNTAEPVAQASVPAPAAPRVRRTFGNQAPTVAPVQNTGRLTGPVTGTVGAVDPEGDQLVYRVTRAPREGVVQLNADGTYTYTPDSDFDGVDTFRVLAIDLGSPKLFRARDTRATALINQGAIKFTFDYTDGGTGWTPEYRQALQDVADGFVQYLIVTSPVTLTYEVGLEDDALASAGSDLTSGAQGYWPTVVQNKLLSGIDANGADYDGTISWNFEYAWALGDTVGSQEYDFVSTAIHELLHSFGFLSIVNAAGQNTGRSWTAFDEFIVTAGGAKPIDRFYQWDTGKNPTLTGHDGGLFFGGANAVAAYGGLVPLFTPDPFEPGSSMSHLDDDTFTGDDQQIMNAYSDKGLGVRVLSAVELGILRDLGFQVVPQAPTVAAAFVGLVFLRRPRRKTAPGGR